MNTKTVGVVIPAYQAADSICDVIRQCKRLPDFVGVIVVDDGSSDGTGDVARNEGAIVIAHERNRGKGAALVSGFTEASRRGWDAVITIDADGQHDPRFLPAFVQRHIATGADVIVGARQREDSPMPLPRRLSNAISSAIVSRLANARITDSQSGYRLIARRIWETLRFERTRYDMESELLIKAGRAGYRIAEIPITTVYGREQSHFRAFRDTFRMAKVFVSLWRDVE
jgi:glycosyltransferase involved in cell wall biosynthesis